MPCHSPRRTRVRPFALLPILVGVAAAGAQTVDLDVTHIERTPKYNYDATKKWPDPGEIVTFHGFIRCWGDAGAPNVASVQYAWRINGQVAGSGTLTNFEPLRPPFNFDYAGYPNPTSDSALRNPNNYPKNPNAFPNPPPTGLRKVTLQWAWQPGRHTVELIVDPTGQIAERSELNNRRRDFTDALSAAFWVEETTWRYFHLYQHRLGIGRNSWEDWIQAQMAKQNELYETAIWDVTPNGCVDRVRIDRIIVVPDGQLPVNGGLPTNNPDSSDKTVDLQWGFVAYDDANSTFYDDHTSLTLNNPFFIETSLIHELGHARYLIDSYGFDVHGPAIQILENGVPVAGTPLMPFLAWGAVYYNVSGGVMSGPYGFRWSPYEAAMLNRIGGQRARCGNMNAPCNIGEYLQDLPQNNIFRLTDADGWPRPYVSVRVYRATGDGQTWYGKVYDNVPDLELDADYLGRVNLGRCPFDSDGTIEHTFGRANGVIVLRIQDGPQVWYRFVEASSFNLEYFKGNRQFAYYTLALPGPATDSDGDGLADGWEYVYFDSLARSGPEDDDQDGLNTLLEFQHRTVPTDPDSDDDGLNDGAEVLVYGSNPLNPDTDGDTLTDGDEVHVHGTSPTLADTDGDGWNDAVDNCKTLFNPDQADLNANGIGDACEDLPRLAAVTAPSRLRVRVVFTKNVEPGSAQQPANYAISGGVTVGNASLGPDGRTVTLTTSPLTPDTPYVLTVNGVRDTDVPPNEVLPNTQAEFGFFSGQRVTAGLQMLYDFESGAGTLVRDVSGVAPAYNLTIRTPSAAQWTSGGLRLTAPVLVSGSLPASKLIDACLASGELTVEAWIIPAAASQTGPARIVTLSGSSTARNFTLGQGPSGGPGDAYEFRLRATTTNGNGLPATATPPGIATSALQHVVSTRTARGEVRIYVDAQPVASGFVGGDFGTWTTTYRLALGNELPSGGTPWLGEYRLVAVYSAALTPFQVRQNYVAGSEPRPPALPGDSNCDGAVTFDDIDPFVLALSGEAAYTAQYPACPYRSNDCNGDGVVDFDDIDAFVALLSG